MLTTRSMSWRTLVSRSGVPRWPRKYLLTTTLVASWLQKSGTSTSFCSKTSLPRLVGDAGGPVLPGDLVVGMDARAGPAALEGQALGRVAVRPCRRSWRRTGRRGRAWGRRSSAAVSAFAWSSPAVHGCDRVAVPSSHLLSLLVVADAWCGVAAASPLRRCCRWSWGPFRTGGRGRRGTCWASRFDQSTPRTIRRVVVDVNPKTTRCSGCSSAPSATCGGFGRPRSNGVVHARGAFVHSARRRCPPVRAPVDMGCPRVVHLSRDGTSVLIVLTCR